MRYLQRGKWVAVLLLGLLLGAYGVLSILSPKETCLTGLVMVRNELGYLIIGDQELCGVRMHYGKIAGPSKMPNPFGGNEEGG